MESGQEQYYDAVESQKKKRDVDDCSRIDKCKYCTASASSPVNLANVGLNALVGCREKEMRQKEAELKKKEDLLREREKKVSVGEDKCTQKRLQRQVSVLAKKLRKLEREDEARERKKREIRGEKMRLYGKELKSSPEEGHHCEFKEKHRH